MHHRPRQQHTEVCRKRTQKVDIFSEVKVGNSMNAAASDSLFVICNGSLDFVLV